MTDYEYERPVRLADFEGTLKRIVPGIGLRETYRGVVAEWHIRLEDMYALAPTAEYAERKIVAIAEQIKIRAIRELGLEPVLEAQRAEVRTYAADNATLAAQNASLSRKIADLEGQLDALTDEDGAS